MKPFSENNYEVEVFLNNMDEDKKKVIIEDFVDELPKMRKRLGISQTELGEKVGLSRQTISLVERKQLTLTWNNYLALMMFFSLNSSSVFYFPKNKGYKNYDLLTQLMRTDKKSKEENAI